MAEDGRIEPGGPRACAGGNGEDVVGGVAEDTAMRDRLLHHAELIWLTDSYGSGAPTTVGTFQ